MGQGSSSLALNTEAFRWTTSGGMQGLGDLPGGAFISVADGVSDDGSVVVGFSHGPRAYEAYRWTSGGGMVGLGFLNSGDDSDSHALATSFDGSTIVGYSGAQAFRWTSTFGMAGLGFLPGDYFSRAFNVSSDGLAVIGLSSLASATLPEQAFRWTAGDGMIGLGHLQVVLTVFRKLFQRMARSLWAEKVSIRRVYITKHSFGTKSMACKT